MYAFFILHPSVIVACWLNSLNLSVFSCSLWLN